MLKWKTVPHCPLPTYEASARGSIEVRLNQTIHLGQWHVSLAFRFEGECFRVPTKTIRADDADAAKSRAAELVLAHRRALLMALVELEP